jgi:SAM-dependent methyltransferase
MLVAMDPLAGSPWSAPNTVSGFATSPPNAVLMDFAQRELRRVPGGRAVDIGCGAARNASPLACLGWDVVGVDLSRPMLDAAHARARAEGCRPRLHVALASADRLPLTSASADLVVAHGIWNLSRSAAEFRRSVAEAARVARPGAALFVFTFSRHTLPDDAAPVPGEPFVFTQFSGHPQCFVTDAQLHEELGAAGFRPDAAVPLTEYNRADGVRLGGGPPVIYEAAFRRA